MIRRLLPPVAAVAVVLAAWQAYVALADVPAYRLPSPGDVAGALSRSRADLVDHVVATAVPAALGLLVAAVLGAGLALALASAGPLRRAVQPLLVASQSVPVVVLAPLFLVPWFGFSTTSRVVVVALVGLFPVAVAALDALLRADADLVRLVRGLGAGRGGELRLVRIPAALPATFAGLRVAAAYATFGAVVGEWVGADRGLGVFIERSRRSFAMDQVLAGVALVAAVSLVLVAAVAVAGRAATPWLAREGRR